MVVPFTLEDLEEVCLLLARLPGWGGTLEDTGVAHGLARADARHGDGLGHGLD